MTHESAGQKKALKSLAAPAESRFYGFREELLQACAEVIANSCSNDLVFVGRSPENVYDLLHALLKKTRHAPRLLLLPFSLRLGTSGTSATLAQSSGDAIAGLERHLSELDLAPAEIAAHLRGVSFVDCVGWGTTFGNLEEMLEFLANRQSVDFKSLSANVRYIGLTKTSLARFAGNVTRRRSFAFPVRPLRS